MISREETSHKGENGKVGVIGGSTDYTGAPSLSARAALRTGCDMVKVLTSNDVKNVVSSYSENLIVEGYDAPYFGEESINLAKELAEWADVLVIGPGLGKVEEDALIEFLKDLSVPAIIDADAIPPAVKSGVSNAVFTPHEGELKEIEDRFDSIREFVEKKGVVVLKKGATDKIYSTDGVREVSAGHSGMTVGGTGDVLTGITAGLISQGANPKEAAVKAAQINGKAGEEAAEKYGNGLLATDIIDIIPKQL